MLHFLGSNFLRRNPQIQTKLAVLSGPQGLILGRPFGERLQLTSLCPSGITAVVQFAFAS